MKQYEIDSFDMDVIISLIVNFCSNNKITETNVKWFSLEIDDELAEIIPVSKLSDRLNELYSAEEGHYSVETQFVNFEWDPDCLRINYPKEKENLIQDFLDYDF